MRGRLQLSDMDVNICVASQNRLVGNEFLYHSNQIDPSKFKIRDNIQNLVTCSLKFAQAFVSARVLIAKNERNICLKPDVTSGNLIFSVYIYESRNRGTEKIHSIEPISAYMVQRRTFSILRQIHIIRTW